MHSWREYAIIQPNFKLGAFEEKKASTAYREPAVGASPAANLAGPLSKRPARSRGPVPCIVPTSGRTALFDNLGGNAEFFVPYARAKNSFLFLKEDL